MYIIEISAFSNGAHRNQSGTFNVIPDGWAKIPQDMSLPLSFPFVDIETEMIDGVLTVTSMTEKEVPVVEDDIIEPTEMEQLRADIDYLAIMTGVEL